LLPTLTRRLQVSLQRGVVRALLLRDAAVRGCPPWLPPLLASATILQLPAAVPHGRPRCLQLPPHCSSAHFATGLLPSWFSQLSLAAFILLPLSGCDRLLLLLMLQRMLVLMFNVSNPISSLQFHAKRRALV
jgi:hypothetical protein